MAEINNISSAAPNIINVAVNGVTIPADQIAEELQYHPAGSADEAVFKATEALIIEQLLLQKAQLYGISGEAEAHEDETPEEAAIRTVLEREVAPSTASDKECQQYYQANLGKFKSAPLMEVSHILLAADHRDFDARQQVREKAEQLIEQLTNNAASFSELAKTLSACPSKEDGGSLGQISKGQTTPEFERQVVLLDEGLALSPIESRYGCHVVYINQKIDGTQMSFEDCKNKIKHYLQDQSYVRAVGQYISILIGEADILGFDFETSGSPLVQ